jgi:hypothetical protein
LPFLASANHDGPSAQVAPGPDDSHYELPVLIEAPCDDNHDDDSENDDSQFELSLNTIRADASGDDVPTCSGDPASLETETPSATSAHDHDVQSPGWSRFVLMILGCISPPPRRESSES